MSELSDNGGRCEGCDREETIYLPQMTESFFQGAGLENGWVTKWLCPDCMAKHSTTCPACYAGARMVECPICGGRGRGPEIIRQVRGPSPVSPSAVDSVLQFAQRYVGEHGAEVFCQQSLLELQASWREALRPIGCDVAECCAVAMPPLRTVENPEGVPEGWGHVSLSDSAGELQDAYLCPRHCQQAWRELKL